MKKILLLLIALPFFLSSLNAQTIYEKKIYGLNVNYSNGVVTSDNGFILLCQNYPFFDHDLVIIKFNENGDSLWSKTYLFPGINDRSAEIFETQDGGLFITGWHYVMKTDSLGNQLWAKSISHTNNSFSNCAVESPWGELVIAGFSSVNPGQDGIHLTKLDSAGNLKFSKLVALFDDPFPHTIINTSDGGFLISGETDTPASTSDAFLIKTDSTGSVEWTRVYGGSAYDSFFSVVETINEDYIAIGGTINPQEIFMVKIDSLGSLIWSRVYHSGTSASVAQKIIRTADNNYVFCGAHQLPNQGSILGKIDQNGTVLWAKSFRPENVSTVSRFDGVHETQDGTIIAHGMHSGNGVFIYLIKCDSNGNSACTSVDLPLTYTPEVSQNIPVSISTTANGSLNNISIQSECFCDSMATICTGNVGLNQSDEIHLNLQIYPNPFTEEINITIDNVENSQIILFDVDSRKLFSKEFYRNTILNVNHLVNGIYFYKIFNNNNFIKSGKIIKIN